MPRQTTHLDAIVSAKTMRTMLATNSKSASEGAAVDPLGRASVGRVIVTSN